ncbi:MAG TPA: hypothetical protein VJR93_09750, partial [Chthoniobacterales bacterium]|nr:hypothetical protein [Chthoniobacterales bacterium]
KQSGLSVALIERERAAIRDTGHTSDRSHVFEKTAAGKFDAKRRRVKANGHWITFDRAAIPDKQPSRRIREYDRGDSFSDKTFPL